MRLRWALILNLPPRSSQTLLQRPAGTLRACARLSLQFYGGGLYVYSGGTANLDGCNVYSNEAQVSARLTPLPRPFFQRPAGTLHVLAFLAQNGAGLYITGVANLDGCQVYQNVAQDVRACLSPLPGFPPAPRWNVTCARFPGAEWSWALRQWRGQPQRVPGVRKCRSTCA